MPLQLSSSSRSFSSTPPCHFLYFQFKQSHLIKAHRNGSHSSIVFQFSAHISDTYREVFEHFAFPFKLLIFYYAQRDERQRLIRDIIRLHLSILRSLYLLLGFQKVPVLAQLAEMSYVCSVSSVPEITVLFAGFVLFYKKKK